MVESPLNALVEAARTGSLTAFASLVQATQEMAYAVAWQVLRQEPDARDAVQEAYLKAFRRLADLEDPAAFPGWFRRIVIAAALDQRRRARVMWLQPEEPATPAILDGVEQRWTDEQQRGLARALLTLSAEERRLCELHYHGGWTAERLALRAGIDAAAMRKRLQRLRDKLRKEVEMDEKRALGGQEVPRNLPGNIIELLARPRLVDLPENPVSLVAATLREAFPGFSTLELPEEVDLEAAVRHLGGDAVYIDRSKLQRIGDERVLRYDLTLPLLLAVRWQGGAQRLAAAGKAYRRENESATHLEAFHQLEMFVIADRDAPDPVAFPGRILDAVDRALGGPEVRITLTEYPTCSRAWSLDVRRQDAWVEVMAWGKYADWVLRALGADPARQIALGAGFGLERIAGLRYGIDDIRKIATARVA